MNEHNAVKLMQALVDGKTVYWMGNPIEMLCGDDNIEFLAIKMQKFDTKNKTTEDYHVGLDMSVNDFIKWADEIAHTLE